MSDTTTDSDAPAPSRPILVWIISIFFFLSAGFTVFSFAIILTGLVPLPEQQRAYFESQTVFDYAITFAIAATNLIGAALLFLLKRRAFHFLLAGFSLGILSTVYQIFARDWLDAVGGPGLVGTAIGWGIGIAIILYAKNLADRGVLR